MWTTVQFQAKTPSATDSPTFNLHLASGRHLQYIGRFRNHPLPPRKVHQAATHSMHNNARSRAMQGHVY